MRMLVGAIYIDSGYLSVKTLDDRSKSTGLSKGFVVFIAVAEVAGGVSVVVGFLQQLAAIGLILIMLGAIQKKIVAWKIGFWGWSYAAGHPVSRMADGSYFSDQDDPRLVMRFAKCW